MKAHQQRKRWGFVAVLLFAATSVLHAQDATCAYPDNEWEAAAPEAVGADAEALDAALAQAETLPYLRSLLIVRGRCLIAERYFGVAAADDLVNSYSVTKSVTASLIGIAIDEGLIPSVTSPLGDFMEIEVDAEQASITLDDLLKMLSGIDWDEASAANIGGMLALERHEVDYILGLPMAHIPGTMWNYSTADSHLLSAALSAAVREPAVEYAQTHLFNPLGITNVAWTADADGVNLGGTQLFWRPQDMARFGLLLVEDGAWNGEQVVPQRWIEYMLRPQLRDPSPYTLSYAAHWWHVYAQGYPPMSAAVGYGGQFILLVPALDVVIVTTGDSTLGSPNRYISGTLAEQRVSEVIDLLIEQVLPAFDD